MAGNPSAFEQWLAEQLRTYPLVEALRGRRSRRFGMGMKIEAGPFTYSSHYAPQPLTDLEEAALAFAASGVTGYALADLAYGRGQGGRMLDGLIGRTVGSPDAVNTVSVVVINDEATYLLRRPQDLSADEIHEAIALSNAGELVKLYHFLRVKIHDGRTAIPVVPGLNFNINKWSVYAKGTTYFLPVNEMSASYINAVLESFDPTMGLFIVDERNWFQPAGIGRFAKSKGGFLDDTNPERLVTMQGIELSLAEAISVEQGGILQNLGLMSQLLGLGGFCNYARNEYAWLQALGFDMQYISSGRYVGANWIVRLGLKLLGRDFPFPYAVSLHKEGKPLLQSYTPPNYPSMSEAVKAFVAHKFGEDGIFRKGASTSAWKKPAEDASKITPPPPEAIEATIAFCEYVFHRYGRFPSYSAPFRTVIGYQASHVDSDFYDMFFVPQALTQPQRDQFRLNPPSKA